MVCIPCHRLRVSLLSLKRWAILLEYCLLASLMPRDRLALAVLRPSSSLALKAAFRAFRSCRPPLSATASGWPGQWCLCDRYIINALGDVGSDSLSVFLEVCSIVVCGSLLEHIPVSGVETVLKCLWRPFRPHLNLFVCRFDDFNERSVCRH